ncbi:pyrimidine utilization protein D [Xylophilus ampelinus]|uniref:Putative carbamate hydrolase RutD n=1 Tax=Xylophilus ampelinus TaxID=54067 RepID=A0A318SHQ0_9BURK|nr:pyrimidine utilization protein D [Xylophilus ampelinus]MCS4510064.1 pyrimidine utilization protein D [Xylophilus ampelinus]PYE78355.1 aminoacrylate hydrolase [Xylophilus ampelinus]
MSLYHEVHRPADAAQTVLLSSGLGGSAAFWKSQIPALAAAGYRVVAYDQRGTGRSPGTLPADYSIAHMARDVAEVLDATGTAHCHLIGHALGGLVGLQLALDAPQRVASLVLVNAWSRPDPHSARCFDARLALLGALGPRAYVEAQPIFLYPAAWCAANAETVQAEVDHAFAHFPGEATMRTRIAALRAFDVDARLAEIAAPTLVMAAMDDTLGPWTRSRRLAEGLPRATLDLVPHGGHAHSVTAPGPFNDRLLAFLARTGADTPVRGPTAPLNE